MNTPPSQKFKIEHLPCSGGWLGNARRHAHASRGRVSSVFWDDIELIGMPFHKAKGACNMQSGLVKENKNLVLRLGPKWSEKVLFSVVG